MTRFSTLGLLLMAGILTLFTITCQRSIADDAQSAVNLLRVSVEHQALPIPIETIPIERPTGDKSDREVIRERFPDGRVKIEREVIQDENENYVNHGSWKMSDRQGRKVAHGEYRHGERHGIWTAWYFPSESPLFSKPPYTDFPGPFISQARFKDGRLDGTWTIYDAKQRKISQWSYLDGQRHGKWTWWYPDGKKLREQTYHDGDVIAQTIVWAPDGKVSRRDFYEEGRKISKHVDFFEDGRKKSEGTNLLAQQVPQSKDDWWNAQPAKGDVVGKDEKHGLWISWYENGQKKMQGQYRHDTEVGTFRWWHPNGQQSITGEFVNGRETSRWTWWHPNGQKASQGAYKNGEETGKWTYWAAGGKVTQRADFSGAESLVLQVPTTSVKIESALPIEKRPTGPIKR